jgi:hypothetical protein
MAKLLSGTRIYGNATVDTNLTVSGATSSTSFSTGALLITGGIGVQGNINTGNSFSALGGVQNTAIGNLVPSTGQFTNLNASGNVTGAGLTVNGSATIGSTLGVTGNIIAPNLLGNVIGNISGNISAAGANTQVIFNDNGLLGASSQLTFNKASNLLIIGGNVNSSGLTVTGSGTFVQTLSASGGIQNTPIGNGVANTGQFTTVSATGNIVGSALTSNSSITAVTTLSAAGGIQNTPIGNVTASSAQFTTVSATGNITASGLTSNSSITAGTTLRAAGGIQNTPIGNETPSSAQFTTINASGNVTVLALTVNTSSTIGSTLSAAGGIQNTAIGNLVPNSGTFTQLVASSISVSGNAVVGNLNVLGTITYINSNITLVVDPIVELNTGPNGTPLSGPTPYDSGLKTHYWDAADRSAFFGRINSSGYFEYYSNVTSESGNVITGVYGTIKTGNLILTSNATIPNINSGNIRNDNYFYANGDPFTGIKVITSSAPPVAGNVVGDQWYNTTNNAMYEYQFDGTNYFWVDITGPAFGYSEQVTTNTGSSSETLSPFLLMGA